MSAGLQKLIGAVVFGGVLAASGYAVGQFAPFTGLAQIAEPFSPIRDQTAMAYASIAGLIGVFVGLSVKAIGNEKSK